MKKGKLRVKCSEAFEKLKPFNTGLAKYGLMVDTREEKVTLFETKESDDYYDITDNEDAFFGFTDDKDEAERLFSSLTSSLTEDGDRYKDYDAVYNNMEKHQYSGYDCCVVINDAYNSMSLIHTSSYLLGSKTYAFSNEHDALTFIKRIELLPKHHLCENDEFMMLRENLSIFHDECLNKTFNIIKIQNDIIFVTGYENCSIKGSEDVHIVCSLDDFDLAEMIYKILINNKKHTGGAFYE